MEDMEIRSKFYTKLSNMRADVNSLDWSKDALLAMPGGRGYQYLSSDKIKRNLAPLFPKHGLEFDQNVVAVEQFPAIGSMSQHWVVTMEIVLTDIDTGYSQTTVVKGEAGDSGDKGIGKALTYAYKRWAVGKFQLADGMDPDAMDASPRGSFTPRTIEETSEIKSKIAANAVKPAVPTQKPVELPPAPAEPAKPATPAEEALQRLKAEADAQKAENAEASKDIEPPTLKYEPSAVQKKAIEKITERYLALAKEGKITNTAYNNMSFECASISNSKMATEFILKYTKKD